VPVIRLIQLLTGCEWGPSDWYVIKCMVNEFRGTILIHVDDIKITNVDEKILTCD